MNQGKNIPGQNREQNQKGGQDRNLNRDKGTREQGQKGGQGQPNQNKKDQQQK